jgi:hypothetical protein
MMRWPASSRVEKVKYNDPSLIEPIRRAPVGRFFGYLPDTDSCPAFVAS